MIHYIKITQQCRQSDDNTQHVSEYSNCVTYDVSKQQCTMKMLNNVSRQYTVDTQGMYKAPKYISNKYSCLSGQKTFLVLRAQSQQFEYH